jgi:hypothetical protein
MAILNKSRSCSTSKNIIFIMLHINLIAVTILTIFFFAGKSSGLASYVYAENKTIQSNQINDLLLGIDPGWWQVIIAVASILLTVIFYFHQQSTSKKEAIKRSCGAIIKEIEENKKILGSNEYEKISYKTNSQPTIQNSIIKYTNAYLDSEAYKSVLYSGFFTFFSAKTQHKLTLLYGRVHSRNDLLSYVHHFKDLYFLHNRDPKSNLDDWYKKVERYDILLTRWEKEIAGLLDEVNALIIEEQPK